MKCANETLFDEHLKSYKHYRHIKGVVLYIKKGCANKCGPWKKLWLTFKTLFTYGGGDETNHV
jgi:hypothetical protein